MLDGRRSAAPRHRRSPAARRRRPPRPPVAIGVGLEARRDRLGLGPARGGDGGACVVLAVALGCRESELYVSASPSSDSSRIGVCARASSMTRVSAAVISSTERIASSLPAIGTVMRSGSAFVSTIATIGMPSLFASATAIFSFFESTMNSEPGQAAHVLMP